jgi:hypothetical protein
MSCTHGRSNVTTSYLRLIRAQFNHESIASEGPRYDQLGYHWGHITVEGRTFLVRGEVISNSYEYLVTYQLCTQVFIFTYNVSDKKSLELLYDLYSNVPTPKDGLITLDRRLEGLQVPRDRYPIIVVGCRFEKEYTKFGGQREVFEEDVAKFVDEHPDCESVGEWVCDGESNENVSFAFEKASELLYQMLLLADLSKVLLPNRSNHGNQSLKRRCLDVLNIIRHRRA